MNEVKEKEIVKFLKENKDLVRVLDDLYVAEAARSFITYLSATPELKPLIEKLRELDVEQTDFGYYYWRHADDFFNDFLLNQ